MPAVNETRIDRRRLSVELDRFQLEALDAIDAGRHVVVPRRRAAARRSSPSTASRTMRGGAAFVLHGAAQGALQPEVPATSPSATDAGEVGLLTGDNAIDGDAPTVVMTTEVLRNMIYARSPALDDLGLVVLDEVHYLQDAYRGPVWEEVIIHLPAHVRLVCLSATVSNAAELAAWIETVRGPTSASSRRGGPCASTTTISSATGRTTSCTSCRRSSAAPPTPTRAKIDAQAVRRGARRPAPDAGERAAGALHAGRGDDRALDGRDLLPAIFFIFSRNQCEEAARRRPPGCD